jgi:hypothetical protein
MAPKGFLTMLASPYLPEADSEKWSPDDARGCLAFIFWATLAGKAIQTFAGMEETTGYDDYAKQGVTGFLVGIPGMMFVCFLLGRYTIQYPERSKILGVLGYLATVGGLLSAFAGGPYAIYKLEKRLSLATLGYIIMMFQGFLWFNYGSFMQCFGAEESKTFDIYAAKMKKENETKNKTGKEEVKSVKSAGHEARDDEETRGRPQHRIEGEQRKRSATPGGLPANAS